MAAATPLVLAHQGGWDEALFVLVPVLVFGVLQWLNRRKDREHSGKGSGKGGDPPAQ